MRNLYITLTVLVVQLSLSAQVISIPDANFKTKLISLGVDLNNDGAIQQSEALQIEELDISNSSISSIAGIDSFKNLRKLNCNNNTLTTLPFDISELHELRCSNNQLTELNNLSSETQELDISYNKISALLLPATTNYYYLNISGNLYTTVDFNDITLEYFYCNDTKLTTLDFSTVKRFSETISIQNNTNLVAINFKNGKFDLCYVVNGGCHFYLILSENPALKYICADDFNHEGPTVVTEVDYFKSYYNLPNISYNTLCSDSNRLSTNSEIIQSKQNFTLYPNPVQNVLTVEMQNLVVISSIRIFNTVGQLVKNISKTSLSNTIEISVSDLKTGTYIVEVNSDSGKMSKKLIKI